MFGVREADLKPTVVALIVGRKKVVLFPFVFLFDDDGDEMRWDLSCRWIGMGEDGIIKSINDNIIGMNTRFIRRISSSEIGIN